MTYALDEFFGGSYTLGKGYEISNFEGP